MESEIQDIKTSIGKCLDNSEAIQNALYVLSHIVVATILVLCLKKFQPLLLAGLLIAMLTYIGVSERQKLSIYALPTIAIIMYSLDFFIMSNNSPDNKNKTNWQILLNTLWKLPYYGIISYYLILFIR